MCVLCVLSDIVGENIEKCWLGWKMCGECMFYFGSIERGGGSWGENGDLCLRFCCWFFGMECVEVCVDYCVCYYFVKVEVVKIVFF